jgi:hypothetical protein
MARPTASNLGGCSYDGATVLPAQIWELCLIYIYMSIIYIIYMCVIIHLHYINH